MQVWNDANITLNSSGEATINTKLISGVIWQIGINKNGQVNDPTVEIVDNLDQKILDITESGSGYTIYNPSTLLQDVNGADGTQSKLLGVSCPLTITIGSGDADGVVNIYILYVGA